MNSFNSLNPLHSLLGSQPIKLNGAPTYPLLEECPIELNGVNETHSFLGGRLIELNGAPTHLLQVCPIELNGAWAILSWKNIPLNSKGSLPILSWGESH